MSRNCPWNLVIFCLNDLFFLFSWLEPNMRQLPERHKLISSLYYFSSFLCLYLPLESISFPKHTCKTHLLSEFGEILPLLIASRITLTQCYWIQILFCLVSLLMVERLPLGPVRSWMVSLTKSYVEVLTASISEYNCILKIRSLKR